MGKTIGVALALKDKCSPQINNISNALGITEKEAKRVNAEVQKLSKDLSGGFKTAAVVCTAAIAAMGVASQQLVMHTIESTSRINDLSDRIGISKKSFQEWDWIMAQNGGDVEALQVGMKKLVGEIDKANGGNKDAIKTFKGLGISIKDSNGHLKSQEQVFDEVAIALQKLPDGVNKAKLASDLFGKSGTQLMPILKNGTTSIANLKKQYEALGITMSDEVIEAGDDLGDTLDTIKASFSAMGSFLGSEFVPAIQNVSNSLLANMPKIKATILPIIQGLGDAINFVIQNMSVFIPIAMGVVSTFVAFNVINGVITMITTLRSIISAVSAAQGIWNALMIANPIGVVAVAIGALVAGLVIAYQKSETFRTVCQAVFDVVGALGRGIAFACQQVWSFIQPLVKVGTTLFMWLTPIGLVIQAVKKLVEMMGGLSGIANGVKNASQWVSEKANTTKPKRNAVGTAFSSGGSTLVGEHGAELVNMPRGANVLPANATQKALSGNGGINVYVTIAGNMIGNNEFLQQMSNIFAKKLQVALAIR